VFTLGLSQARCPRWYTEGMSVLEEWDPGIQSDKILAKHQNEGDLVRVEDLDSAFHRPKNAMAFSLVYALSGEIVRFLNGRLGPSIHLDLMKGFSTGRPVLDTLSSVTGLAFDEIDTGVARQVEKRTKGMSLSGISELPALFVEEASSTFRKRSREESLYQLSEALNLHKWQEAVEVADSRLKRRRRDLPFMEAKALAKYHLGAKRDARKSAEAILEVTPENYSAFRVLGWLDRDNKRWERAVERLMAAHKLRPRQTGPNSPIQIAEEILSKRKMKDRLAEVLEKRLALQPTDEKGFRDLAELLLARGETDQAMEAVRQAVYCAPYESKGQILLGQALLAKGDAIEALKRFEVASELDKKSGKPSLGMARAYLAAGSPEAALVASNHALELDPTLEEARLLAEEIDGTRTANQEEPE